MPEIPELEAFKSIVKSKCLNENITDIKSPDTSLIKLISFSAFKNNLVGHKFISVERQGKYLIIDINSSEYKLVMHFGLTGFLYYTKDLQEKVAFSKIQFIFGDSVLHWINIRKFGKVWLVKDLDKIKGIKELGPDPLKLSSKEFVESANKYKTKNVKVFLMDQSVISGIGNEYSDEILFQAGIDPHHKISDLSGNDLLEIYNQIKKVLRYAITLRLKDVKKMPKQNFLSKLDKKTFKSSYLQAHRHTDMLCPKNKNHKLKKVTIGGRSAYYCPVDQK